MSVSCSFTKRLPFPYQTGQSAPSLPLTQGQIAIAHDLRSNTDTTKIMIFLNMICIVVIKDATNWVENVTFLTISVSLPHLHLNQTAAKQLCSCIEALMKQFHFLLHVRCFCTCAVNIIHFPYGHWWLLYQVIKWHKGNAGTTPITLFKNAHVWKNINNVD